MVWAGQGRAGTARLKYNAPRWSGQGNQEGRGKQTTIAKGKVAGCWAVIIRRGRESEGKIETDNNIKKSMAEQ